MFNTENIGIILLHYGAATASKPLFTFTQPMIKAKKCLYKGVIVPTALYEAEAWGMRSAERRKVNVLEMRCLVLT